jgi:2-amino-4-hydroxy-6-hydroxymethyldihydropteridine diphosphokinase
MANGPGGARPPVPDRLVHTALSVNSYSRSLRKPKRVHTCVSIIAESRNWLYRHHSRCAEALTRTLIQSRKIGVLLLGLGGNTPGRWGTPRENFVRAVKELEAAGLIIVKSSLMYRTAAVGGGRQQAYLNAVLVAKGGMAPGCLLRLVKRIERSAGRRAAPPMQPRPLDIDVLDYGGRRLNWPCRQRERGRLVLPHPLLDKRGFVLVPLMEIAPRWSHPVLGCRPKTMMARLGSGAARGVRQALDFRLRACEKAPR